MNIQIYGSKKSNDTKKAQRFFKERGIPFQFVDLSQNKMHQGELNSILKSLKMKLDDIFDKSSKLYSSCYIEYLSDDEDKIYKLLDNQMMMKQPVVRNGKVATIGNQPQIWESWVKEAKNG